MIPEAADYIAKAREALQDAHKIAAIDLASAAARSAYYAVLHAAEAFIFEKTGKVVKTHSGVRTEISRLLRGVPKFDDDSKKFLA